MKHEHRSPLAIVRQSAGSQAGLSPLDALGLAIDLLRHTEWQARQPIGPFVEAVVAALRGNRAQIVLTDDQRPLALGIWHYVDDLTHAKWLESAPPMAPDLWSLPQPDSAEGHLWFSTLLTPFSTPLPLMRQLRERHRQASVAWAACPDRPACRRLWYGTKIDCMP